MNVSPLHLQGKVVGEAPLLPFPDSPLRPLLAADEFASGMTSLEEAISVAKSWTTGPTRPGALIISGHGKFEAYALNMQAFAGAAAGPYHFEGVAEVSYPRHLLSEGAAFVDGNTVVTR